MPGSMDARSVLTRHPTALVEAVPLVVEAAFIVEEVAAAATVADKVRTILAPL